MADRVVRLTDIVDVVWTTSGDVVVIKVTGFVGKQRVRVELSVQDWNAHIMPKAIRAGVEAQVQKWTTARGRLQ